MLNTRYIRDQDKQNFFSYGASLQSNGNSIKQINYTKHWTHQIIEERITMVILRKIQGKSRGKAGWGILHIRVCWLSVKE